MAKTEHDWRNDVAWYSHETFVPKAIKAGLVVLLPVLARLEVAGLENLPPDGPCIVATNHLSLWDVLVMGHFLPRHPFFMAKQELFAIPAIGWIIRRGGAFPVRRSGQDSWAMEQAGRLLEVGRVVYMFPEGTRSGKAARLRRGKVGVTQLALAHRVPVVPGAITGTQRLGPGLRLANRITVELAPPVDVAAMAGPPPHGRDIMRELTDLLMGRIAAMLPPEYRGYYAS